jgi:hypothetical protein
VFFFALRQKSPCYARRQIPGRFALEWVQRIESGQLAITSDGVDEAMKIGTHDEEQHLLTSGRENQQQNSKQKAMFKIQMTETSRRKNQNKKT